MEGRIEDVDLYALVEILSGRRSRNELRIRRRGQDDALLVFAAGELVDARAGELRGEEALFEILTWKEGRFRVLETWP
jgi:hypothetical protein